MKVIILLFLLPSVLLAQQTHPDSLWQTIPFSPHQANGGRFEDLYMLDDMSGYGVDFGGHLYCFDIDSAWVRNIERVPGINFNGTRSVAFLNKNKGWIGILDSDTPLITTNDGGATWDSVGIEGPLPLGICGLSLVNDSVLFGAGAFDVGLFDSTTKTTVIRTTDGGATFVSIDMSPYASSLVDCRFTSKDNGLVTGTAGGKNYHEGNAVVLKTTDGGHSWKSVYRSTRTGEQGWKIFFRTATEGYVALQSPMEPAVTSPIYILKTTDGGDSWNEILIGHGTRAISPQGVCFPDAMHGIVGGYSDSVFTTTDGGVTWEQFSSNKLQGINRSRHINDTTSYVISSQVLALKKGTPISVKNVSITQTAVPYPNPATEFVKIELPPEGRTVVDVIDSKGTVISTIHDKVFTFCRNSLTSSRK
jgi:photosystem II stability/assembly factor-like uncharacterized protein